MTCPGFQLNFEIIAYFIANTLVATCHSAMGNEYGQQEQVARPGITYHSWGGQSLTVLVSSSKGQNNCSKKNFHFHLKTTLNACMPSDHRDLETKQTNKKSSYLMVWFSFLL